MKFVKFCCCDYSAVTAEPELFAADCHFIDGRVPSLERFGIIQLCGEHCQHIAGVDVACNDVCTNIFNINGCFVVNNRVITDGQFITFGRRKRFRRKLP